MWSLLVREEQGDGSAAQHYESRCGLGGVKAKGAASDQSDGRVSTLDPAVGQAQADGGEDAVAVGADGAAQLDERGQPRALRPAAPAVQEAGDFGGVQVTGEDRAQRLLALVGAPDRAAAAADRGLA